MAKKNPSTRTARTYNGHPNWTLWNVALHFGNDESTYFHCLDLIKDHGLAGATERLYAEIGGTRTVDGALYSKTSIRYGLRSLME